MFFLNKHFYILTIITVITKYTNSKLYKIISTIVKIFVFVNIIFFTVYIVYYSDFSSFISGISIYNDIIKPYIDFIINMWNNYITLKIEDTYIKNSNITKDHIVNDINVKIKEGVKESIKEIMDEVLDKIHEDELNSKANLLKYSALFGSTLFFVYFLLYLPGAGITPEELANYNWCNQSLIELKVHIVNFFSNSNNGGNGTSSTTITNSNINLPSPTESVITEASGSSLTPKGHGSPLGINTELSAFNPNPNITKIDVSTQTILDGITVSKMDKAIDMINHTLPVEANNIIRDRVNDFVINITD